MPGSNLDSNAIDRQRERRGFYIHAATFAMVNLILLVVNLRKSPGYLWFKWVLLDWGVGLATHAWIVFRTNRPRT
jgi:hypothetical protein